MVLNETTYRVRGRRGGSTGLQSRNPARLRPHLGWTMGLFGKCFLHWAPTAKDWQNHYLQSANWCGKSSRPTGSHGRMAPHIRLKLQKGHWRWMGWEFGAFAHHGDLRPHSHFNKLRCLAATEVKIKHLSLLTRHQGLPEGKVLLTTSAHPLRVSPWPEAGDSSPRASSQPVPAFGMGWRAGGWYLQRKTCQEQQLPCHSELVLSTVPLLSQTHPGTHLLLPGVPEVFFTGHVSPNGQFSGVINSLQFR